MKGESERLLSNTGLSISTLGNPATLTQSTNRPLIKDGIRGFSLLHIKRLSSVSSLSFLADLPHFHLSNQVKTSPSPLSVFLPHSLNFPADQFPSSFIPHKLILHTLSLWTHWTIPHSSPKKGCKDTITSEVTLCLSPVSRESCLGLDWPAGKGTGRERTLQLFWKAP